MKIFYGFFLALFFCMPAFAAERVTLTISGELTLIESFHASIERYYKTDYILLDSATAVNGVFQFDIDNSKPSFYRVRIKGLPDIPIIADEEEHEIELVGWLENYQQGNYVIFKSAVNQCYLKIKRAEKDFGGSYQGLVSGLREQHLDPAMKAVYEGRLEKAIASYDEQLKSLQNSYPHTICAEFIIPDLLFTLRLEDAQWLKAYPRYLDFMAAHFFDHFDLTDTRQLSFPMLFETLKYFRNEWVGADTLKQKQWIGSVLNAKPMHYDLRQFLTTYLLRNYAEENNGMAVGYVFKTIGDTIFDTITTDGRYIMLMKGLQPGLPGFMFSLADTNGRMVSVAEMSKRQPYTFLLFYSHDCEHCIEQIPLVKGVAMQDMAHKIAVVAIDINPDKKGWRSFVADQKLPFTNLLLDEAHAGAVMMHYAVTGIPTMVLVDSQGNILDRFSSVDKIKALLH